MPDASGIYKTIFNSLKWAKMANRVIRDWTTSEKVNLLSEGAENTFTRLIMKADDYGSFHSNIKLIKAALYPLKDYSEGQVASWVNECIKAGLMFIYTVDGKQYLRIKDFNQRLRAMRGVFPQPADNSQTNDRESLTLGGNPPPETKRNEVEDETETETKATAGETPPVIVWPSFDDFWELYDKKQDRPKCEKKWKKIKQAAREKIMEHLELYVRSTPDPQYRKNPSTYLMNESWNNEIIIPKPNGSTDKRQQGIDSLKATFATQIVGDNRGK